MRLAARDRTGTVTGVFLVAETSMRAQGRVVDIDALTRILRRVGADVVVIRDCGAGSAKRLRRNLGHRHVHCHDDPDGTYAVLADTPITVTASDTGRAAHVELPATTTGSGPVTLVVAVQPAAVHLHALPVEPDADADGIVEHGTQFDADGIVTCGLRIRGGGTYTHADATATWVRLSVPPPARTAATHDPHTP